ncbi:VWA domain-containing protein [Haladaptatus sp. DFWS20]|uniref:VWA domain-containing protein n=1 Tax=Haladaptatus sp. DFWS20 TaxID=3403467 RepID=UPI003EB6EAE6
MAERELCSGAVGAHVADALVTFERDLRDAGVDVSANASIMAAQALVTVGLNDSTTARTALQSVFVSRSADIDTFREHFPAFWARLFGVADDRDERADDPRRLGEKHQNRSATADTSAENSDVPARDPTPEETVRRARSSCRLVRSDAGNGTDRMAARYSPIGRGEPLEIAAGQLSTAELVPAVDRLGEVLATLTRRRRVDGPHGRPDTRRALRQSLSTGGCVFDIPTRSKRVDAVRATLLVDVSRSVLDSINREFLVTFLRTIHSRWRNVRTFLFDTDVEEVTVALDAPTADDVVTALAAAEMEWGGGTRIGHAVSTLRTDHLDAVDRRTTVIFVSDGLETGDVSALADGMAWVANRAAAIVWLNPLAAADEYEPTCRGMVAARRSIDGLFGFADSRDVTAIADELERYGLGGTVGYEFHHRRPTRPVSRE